MSHNKKPKLDVDKLFETEAKRLAREAERGEKTINPFSSNPEARLLPTDEIVVKQTPGSTAG